MKKLILLLTLFTFLFSTSVFAHVSNEKTIYDDIEYSEAKEQIVYLRGLNVIAYEHGAHLFKPQDLLTKGDLAFWAASFKGLAGHKAEKEEVQNLALENGLINSLEGNASYEDVNIAYFNGAASIENVEKELTREEFALFMGQFLTEPVEGKTLFEMAGFEAGPSGVVENVSFETEGEGQEAYKIFSYSINGSDYQLSQHPKVLYGPIDLSLWEGVEIKESWFAPGHGEERALQIVVVKEDQFSDDEILNTNKDIDNKINGTSEQKKQNEQSQNGLPLIPLGGLILLVVILGWLFIRKK